MSQPLVSVVTPFHNTALYLAQCIESVLAQTYTRFEYILSDNCSTDGSGEIAETYARRDARIRLVRRPQLLSQVHHYNRAIAEISDDSTYCKLVQADDWIFPECLQLMVEACKQSESIGLVSSYWLKGQEVRGLGFPRAQSMLPGQEMARLFLRNGTWVFGSPTAVMYRSSLVKGCRPFYDESQLHEDTDKCMQIMEHWNFGFVHQVLSFSRADNESISFSARAFQPTALDRYILVQRYASTFLEASEAASLKKKSKQAYYRVLAHEVLHFRESAFWRYHARGLKTLGETLHWPYLALQFGETLLHMAASPCDTAVRAMSYWKRQRVRRQKAKN